MKQKKFKEITRRDIKEWNLKRIFLEVIKSQNEQNEIECTYFIDSDSFMLMYIHEWDERVEEYFSMIKDYVKSAEKYFFYDCNDQETQDLKNTAREILGSQNSIYEIISEKNDFTLIVYSELKKQKKKALERAIREIEAYVDEDEVDLESEFWCEKRIQKMFHKWLKDDVIVEMLFKDFGVENVED